MILMMRITFCFAVVCLLITVCASSQNLIVHHDFLKEKSEYRKVKKNGDTTLLRKNGFRGKGNITLVISNYNPFYWVSTVEKIEEPKEESNLIKLFNPLGLLKQIGGGAIDQFMQMSQVAGSRGSTKMSRVFVQYKANYNEIVKMLTTMNQYHLAEQKLVALKYNITDPSDEIKQKASDVLITTSGIGSIELDSAINKARELDARYEYLKYSLDTLYRSFITAYHSEETTALDETEKEFWNNIRVDLENYYQPKLATLDNQQTKTPFTNEVSKITALYKEISGTTFEYRYQLTGNKDVSALRVLSSPATGLSAKADTIARVIPVRRKTGLRLTNSFGISFSAFNEKEYFVGQDSIVGSTQANLFTPTLSSFVHFYAANTGNIKWGGNVGVGISLTSTEKGISFLGGLSAIFGRRDELIISFGAVGAKVNQLTNGWKTGDHVSNPGNFTLPTESYYRLGGFVGFSFNVAALTNKK